jgi:PEP-CTERM motif
MFKRMAQVSLAMGLVGLVFAGSASAAWTGAVSDDWADAGNWDSGVPTAATAVTLLDNASLPDVTIYSGTNAEVADFTMFANFDVGGNQSLTVKSGASLHSFLNFDLGFFGGPETVTLNVEDGATVTVDGAYPGGRPGPNTTNLAGTLTTGNFFMGGSDLIDFAATGVLIASGDTSPALGMLYADLIPLWIDAGLITDRGVTSSDPGWGVTNGIKFVFDPIADTTTLTSIGVVSLTGDLDGDGFVGIADLNIVLGNWNQNVPPGDPLADPSGDGFVGIEDLNTVLGNWNAGTPPGSTAVPEPATLALFGIGGVASLRRRR